MRPLRIKPTGKRLLRKASREAIADYFSSLTTSQRRSKWLLITNRYRVNCTQRYADDLRAIPPSVDHAALRAYLAASGPTHVVDAWSLLGRAADAALRNDVYSAVHLGYYAELRAGMALLACEGVGVFNNRHPVLDRTGTTQVLPKSLVWDAISSNYQDRWAGTHAIVWPCLKHWSGLAKAFELFEDVCSPAGLPLSEWLARLGSSVSARAIAKNWLSIWGLDLSILEGDHESRNLASYRPSELRLPELPSVVDTLAFITELWSCLEPAAYGSFPTLERWLLKRALAAGGVVGPFNAGSLGTVGIGGAEEAAWLVVLNAAGQSRLLVEAEDRSLIDTSACHFQVISRACLLLMLATAAARRHLRRAGYSRDDLRFWWHRHGVERGLWSAASEVEPIDLWADVRDSLADVSEWCAEQGAAAELSVWRRTAGRSIHLLGAAELVGIWGLLP